MYQRRALSTTAIGVILLVLIIVIASFGTYLYSNRQKTPSYEEYANPHLLVDGNWLLAHIDDPTIRIVDVRSDEEYQSGHIEKAVRLELASIRATVNGVRGMVASKTVIEDIFGKLGLTRESYIILYDEGDSLDAARVFWTLEYYGHEEVSILNGGWSKWVNDEYPQSVETPLFDEMIYSATVRPALIANAQYILENFENPAVLVLDVRSSLEFDGIEVKSKRGGHIPGSVNVEWRDALNADGTFKSAGELFQLYQRVGVTHDKEIITSCQTGHRASHGYFTMRLLGYTARMYDGSWEEWGNKEGLPIES